MKTFLMLTAAILLFTSLGLGGVGSYIYFSARQDCAEMVVRAKDKAQTAIAATGTAQETSLKKDADDARKGAMWSCENFRDRKTNALLFGFGTLVSIVIAAVVLFFLRRISSERIA